MKTLRKQMDDAMILHGFKRIRHYGLLGPAHKAANLAAARAALDAPAQDPVVLESVEAFMLRVANIEWLNCPHCRKGRFRVVQAINPAVKMDCAKARSPLLLR